MANGLSEKIIENSDELQVRLGRLNRVTCRFEREKRSIRYFINSQGWLNFKGVDRGKLAIGFRSLEDYIRKTNLTPVFIFDTKFLGRELPFREDGFIVLNPKTYFQFIKKAGKSREQLARLFFEPREANEHEVYEKLKTAQLSVANIERIKELKDTIVEFENKLKNKEPENDLRDYLISHPELLDPGYFNSSAKKEEVLEVGKADIVVKLNRHGLLEDIAVFELKLSDEVLEVSHRPNIKKQSATVSGGLAQILAYVDDKSAEDKEAFVKGYLILGRQEDTGELKTIKRLNKFLHNITILTYDDVLERAKQIIGLIEPKNANRINTDANNQISSIAIPLKQTTTETQPVQESKTP